MTDQEMREAFEYHFSREFESFLDEDGHFEVIDFWEWLVNVIGVDTDEYGGPRTYVIDEVGQEMADWIGEYVFDESDIVDLVKNHLGLDEVEVSDMESIEGMPGMLIHMRGTKNVDDDEELEEYDEDGREGIEYDMEELREAVNDVTTYFLEMMDGREFGFGLSVLVNLAAKVTHTIYRESDIPPQHEQEFYQNFLDNLADALNDL